MLPERNRKHQRESADVRKRREHKRVRAPRSVSARKIGGAPQKYRGNAVGSRSELCH